MPRLIMPLLCGTFILAGSIAGHAQTSTVTTGPNGKPCKVVHSDGAGDTGSMSSSVTAGPGGVSSATTGGPSVTMRSGNGSSSSSASSSSSGGTTMTTTGDGDCVVTVPKGK